MKDKLKQYTDIKPVVMDGAPDAHNVFLQVTNQRFCITPYACETNEEAEWIRDQLLVALERIVRESRAE